MAVQEHKFQREPLKTSSSSGSSSTSQQTWDYASGQDMASKKSADMADLDSSRYQAAMSDPMSLVSSGNRIRKLQAYLNAYRGGYQLPDQEVTPFARLGGASSSETTTSSSQIG